MSAFFPIYTADQLRTFTLTANSELEKRNITYIVNRVYNDVLRAAKNGDYSSSTDITGSTYTTKEISESVTALRSIFPTPSVVNSPSPTTVTKTIMVSWV